MDLFSSRWHRIDQSSDFHWPQRPVLMVLLAMPGKYPRVLTFEGVKSDALFAYLPPFDILALLSMLRLKWTVSERMHHKTNVAAATNLNFPALLLIALYERRTLWMSDKKYWLSTSLRTPGGSYEKSRRSRR